MESNVAPQVDLTGGKLPVGATIGADLTVTGVLGQGGTGIVYCAFHALLQRDVAVKMSHVYGANQEDARARLVREAKMCASVRNAQLPRIYALDALPDGTPYIVMEKVGGAALSHVLEGGRLAPRVVCEIARQLLSALVAVHKKGIVHRDVKPGNLMVDLAHPDGLRLRLLDFGVGKVLRPENPEQASLTCQGELLGTPLYMAPEQVLGQPVDERADLYAAGVVMYEMFAGRTPFEANSLGEVFAAVLRDEITPLSAVRPDLPESLLAVVHKATAKQPEQRYHTAREMLTALEVAMAEVTSEVPAPPITMVVPRPTAAAMDEVEQTLVYRPGVRSTLAESAQVGKHRRASLLSLARTMRAMAAGRGRMPLVRPGLRARQNDAAERG